MKRLKVKIKEDIKKHCWDQVNKYNFGKRDRYNGNKEQQYTGIVGESVIRDMFDMNYVDGKSGFDGGFDLRYEGKTYDVKTMGREVDVKDSYTNNFLKKHQAARKKVKIERYLI